MSENEYYQKTVDESYLAATTSPKGLKNDEVRRRQKKLGLNQISKRTINIFSITLRQITENPLMLILAAATFISFLLGQRISSYYIFGLILVSIFLGLWNEYSAEKTIDGLLKRISSSVIVIRNNIEQEILAHDLTIGDIVVVDTGSIIPADLRFIEVKDLEINESSLTGESKTIFKTSEQIQKDNLTLGEMTNIGFMGTNVVSGSGRGIVIGIGKGTEYGKIAQISTFLKPSTEFQKGLEQFGKLIVRVIIILTIIIFIVNAFLHHPILDSLLFALAIAVGLTPELLPVIVTISLAHGAGKLGKKHVIAKQLISIENLGNIDILCTDKTGTLTEGNIQVIDYVDVNEKKDEEILKLSLMCNSAIVNSRIIGNGIDVALWQFARKNKITLQKGFKKIDEYPFDYQRRIMFTVVAYKGEYHLIAKGAPEAIMTLCNKNQSIEFKKEFSNFNKIGERVIAIASKKVSEKSEYTIEDARDLEMKGFITFLDVLKKTTKEALQKLKDLHVDVKVITGDTEVIAKKICTEAGMIIENIASGSEIQHLNDNELSLLAEKTNIFARVNPEQKLRIIGALKKNGHTVGYLGDGINDIPSLKNADVGISVNTAVDVAKQAASIVLLRKSLNVLADGIIEGRRTFSNTIKYILMATSSNFGNMFSAAGASFFLPFLPMTPVQILLTNGLYDVSQMSIPSDNVDPESLLKPRHWNNKFIKNYMLFFGPLSSLYDFLTFGVMYFIFKARGAQFQTGWFIESILTEILVVFVIRTSRSPFKSKPSKWLILTSSTLCLIGITIPFTPIAKYLNFAAPPPLYFVILIGLVTTYLILVEFVKQKFLKKYTL